MEINATKLLHILQKKENSEIFTYMTCGGRVNIGGFYIQMGQGIQKSAK